MPHSIRFDRLPAWVLLAGALLAVAAVIQGVERLLPEADPPPVAEPSIFHAPERPVVEEKPDGTIELTFGWNHTRIGIDENEGRSAFLVCMREGIAREFPAGEAGEPAPHRTRRETSRAWRDLQDACLRLALSEHRAEPPGESERLPVPIPAIPGAPPPAPPARGAGRAR